MRNITPKREKEILKSKEEFQTRLLLQDPNTNPRLRLEALIQFHPAKSIRQILNHARISI